MFLRKLAVAAAAAAAITAACTSTGSPGASGGTASGGAGCTVGVSWNNYDDERTKNADEPAIKEALAAGVLLDLRE